MNNGYWQDLGPKNTVTYSEAIAWLLLNDRLRWLEGGELSQPAMVVAGMFGRSADALRSDTKAAKTGKVTLTEAMA